MVSGDALVRTLSTARRLEDTHSNGGKLPTGRLPKQWRRLWRWAKAVLRTSYVWRGKSTGFEATRRLQNFLARLLPQHGFRPVQRQATTEKGAMTTSAEMTRMIQS